MSLFLAVNLVSLRVAREEITKQKEFSFFIFTQFYQRVLIAQVWLMMMFEETSKHVPKTEKRSCVFKNIYSIHINQVFHTINI